MPKPFGAQLPTIRTEVPGPLSTSWIERLIEVECPAITARRDRRRKSGARDPMVWAQASGANVCDVDGNTFVDLAGGFAVAAVGHAHPAVQQAATEQLSTLVHAMGDLFPSREKILLAEELARLAPAPLSRSILAVGGSDAVESAIKTAMLATGRRRVLGFAGGYHGMSLGALGVSGYRDSFREPFVGQAGHSDIRLPYPGLPDSPWEHDDGTQALAYIDWLLGSDVAGSASVAALIIEPIQGRGGDIVPPAGFLMGLRELTRKHDVLLIFDEIYTGFGRSGRWFALEYEGVVPDILVVGKALGGGVSIGATLASAELMSAWGSPEGESIHTSTFLGNPLAARMALATLRVLEEEQLVERSARLGERAMQRLKAELSNTAGVGAIRGRGLMIGIELRDAAGKRAPAAGVQAMSDLLQRGFITSPGGTMGEVISLAPPLMIDEALLDAGLAEIVRWLRERAASL